MKITRHAQQRMEERLNVKGAKAQRKHIEKVMLKGATAINSEIPKPLVGMIKRKSSHYLDKSVYFRIYNKSVYLFSKRYNNRNYSTRKHIAMWYIFRWYKQEKNNN